MSEVDEFEDDIEGLALDDEDDL